MRFSDDETQAGDPSLEDMLRLYMASKPRRYGLFGGQYEDYMNRVAAASGPVSGQGSGGGDLFAVNSGPPLHETVLRTSDPPAQLYLAGGPQQVKEMAASSAPASPAQPVDPSQTDVFQPGPDGKLQPIPGWHTTGPFDFGKWGHNVNWKGVGHDLGKILFESPVGTFMGAEMVPEEILKLLLGFGTLGQNTLDDLHEKTKPK